MWNTTEFKLGDVPEHSTHAVVFRYLGNKKVARTPEERYNVSSSCGCADPVWDPDKKEIRVRYTSGIIPVHLAAGGATRVQIRKSVSVTFEDMTTEKLLITGNIVKTKK